MLLVYYGEALGLSTLDMKLRAGVVLLGLWWGLFSLPAIFVLRDLAPPRERDDRQCRGQQPHLPSLSHALHAVLPKCDPMRADAPPYVCGDGMLATRSPAVLRDFRAAASRRAKCDEGWSWSARETNAHIRFDFSTEGQMRIANEELQQWRGRFMEAVATPWQVERLFDRLPDIVFSIKDRGGRYVSISAAAARPLAESSSSD